MDFDHFTEAISLQTVKYLRSPYHLSAAVCSFSPRRLPIPCFPSPVSCHPIHLHFTESKLLFLRAWGEGCTSLSQMPNTSFLPSRVWLALKPQAWSLCGSPTCQLWTVNTSFQQLLRGPQLLWVRCLSGALPSSESCLGRTQKRLVSCLFQLPSLVRSTLKQVSRLTLAILGFEEDAVNASVWDYMVGLKSLPRVSAWSTESPLKDRL